MAYTEADLAAWDQAVIDSRGALQISFNGQTVTFASFDDRARQRARIVTSINKAAGTPPYHLAVTRKFT